MKNILVGLIISLVLFSGAGMYLNYQTQKTSIYNTMTKVDQIEQKDKEYVIYFSSPTCGYCQQVEPQIKEFRVDFKKAKIPFYLMDMSDSKNAGYFNGDGKLNESYFNFAKDVPKGFKLNDYRITGTPSAVYIKDGKIKDISVGIEYDGDDSRPHGVVNMFNKVLNK